MSLNTTGNQLKYGLIKRSGGNVGKSSSSSATDLQPNKRRPGLFQDALEESDEEDVGCDIMKKSLLAGSSMGKSAGKTLPFMIKLISVSLH